MRVYEVLDNLKYKSFGSDDDSDEIRQRNLSYLNEAHIEMWSAIARLDDRYLLRKTITLNFNNEYKIPLIPAEIARLEIFDSNGKPLTKVNPQDLLESPNLNVRTDTYIVESPSLVKLTYAPSQQDAIDLSLSYIYTPEAQLLNETDDLDAIYSLDLQKLLEDGAFEYISISEEGIRSSSQKQQSALKWITKLNDKKASLMNARPFSTYGKWR